ncbi:MAG: S8 family serine peptidase [Oscillospiraceae bacterium]|nr:S8 family serine peptidase [Oscillospiraceae bacterium]
MKKFIFFILSISIMLLIQVTVSAEYIVKLKSDIRLMNAEEEIKGLTLAVPALGLYTADNITDIDPALIEFAEENTEVVLFDSYDYSHASERWEHTLTGVRSMWDTGVYGSGVRVGVIDSGCNSHEALSGNLQTGANFIDESGDTIDNIGHGTSVCGVIAARYESGSAIGAAHKTEIIPIKFIDVNKNGKTIGGTIMSLAKSMISAVDDFQCDIINMSCGSASGSAALKEAVDYAASKGVIMVAAAGNDGNTQYNYPAAYENVIGVGSVGAEKKRSSFSNVNDSVFVTAPGEKVNVLAGTDKYGQNSGTSFSAPYVSGVIALMREIRPEITLSEVRNIISETAEDLGSNGYDNYFGHGLIRADAIADYMLGESDYFTSGIDLCPEDDFYEIRLRVRDGVKTPVCLFAGYEEGKLGQISADKQYIDDNIFMVRMKKTDGEEVKGIIWESFDTMKPIEF